MSFSLALAIYFICWWIVLFAVLPLRLGAPPPDGKKDVFSEASGAPQNPAMGRKFALTTLVSAGIFALIYAVFAFEMVKLDSLPF
jgi:predicted secreted protein